MKTLKLILLFAAVTLVSQSFAYSIFNLPAFKSNVNPIDNLFTVIETHATTAKADKTRVDVDNFTDTIVIDLDEVVVESSFPNSAHTCFAEQVPYPAFAQEQGIEGAVVVKFAFDENGHARILEAMSNDARLTEYVKRKIENIQLKNCVVEMDKPYFMRFLFKLY